MDNKYVINALAALIPVVIGAIWYNPKVFGKFWMNAAGLTEDRLKAGNLILIYVLSYIGSYYISRSMGSIVIHQHGLYSMLAGNPDMQDKSSALYNTVQGLMDKYGTNFRTFKHGAYHGFWTGIYFIAPVIGILTLFERRSVLYFIIHSLYWIICLTLMGGIVSAYMPFP